MVSKVVRLIYICWCWLSIGVDHELLIYPSPYFLLLFLLLCYPPLLTIKRAGACARAHTHTHTHTHPLSLSLSPVIQQSYGNRQNTNLITVRNLYISRNVVFKNFLSTDILWSSVDNRIKRTTTVKTIFNILKF